MAVNCNRACSLRRIGRCVLISRIKKLVMALHTTVFSTVACFTKELSVGTQMATTQVPGFQRFPSVILRKAAQGLDLSLRSPLLTSPNPTRLYRYFGLGVNVDRTLARSELMICSGRTMVASDSSELPPTHFPSNTVAAALDLPHRSNRTSRWYFGSSSGTTET